MTNPLMNNAISRLSHHALIASLACCVALTFAPTSHAKQSDRDQPMDLRAGSGDFVLQDNGTSTIAGGVTITQGSLKLQSNQAKVHRSAGEVTKIVFEGSPAQFDVVDDDGQPVHAQSRRIEYQTAGEVIVLTGDVTIKRPNATMRSERVTYNIQDGKMKADGQGERIHMRLMPKKKAATSEGS